MAYKNQLFWRMACLCLLLVCVCSLPAKQYQDTLMSSKGIMVILKYSTEIRDGKCTLTISHHQKKKMDPKSCTYQGDLNDLVIMFFDQRMPNDDYGDIIISESNSIRPEVFYLDEFTPSKKGFYWLRKSDDKLKIIFPSTGKVSKVDIPIFLAKKEKEKTKWFPSPFKKGKSPTEYALIDNCDDLKVQIMNPTEIKTKLIQVKDSTEETIMVNPLPNGDDFPIGPMQMPYDGIQENPSNAKALEMCKTVNDLLPLQISSQFDETLVENYNNLKVLLKEVDAIYQRNINEVIKNYNKRLRQLKSEEINQACHRFLASLDNCDRSKDMHYLEGEKTRLEKMLEDSTLPKDMKNQLNEALDAHRDKEKELDDKEDKKNKLMWGGGILAVILGWIGKEFFDYWIERKRWIEDQKVANQASGRYVRRLKYAVERKWYQFWRKKKHDARNTARKKWKDFFKSKSKTETTGSSKSSSTTTRTPKSQPSSTTAQTSSQMNLGKTVTSADGKQYNVKKGKKKTK